MELVGGDGEFGYEFDFDVGWVEGASDTFGIVLCDVRGAEDALDAAGLDVELEVAEAVASAGLHLA